MAATEHSVEDPQALKQLNKELHATIKQLTKQVSELKTETQTKDEIIQSLEKELESVLKLSSRNKQTLHQNRGKTQTTEQKKEEPKSRGVIGIVGASQMGAQIATLLSLKRYKMIVIDRQKIMLQKAKEINKSICDSYLQQNLISKQDIESAEIIYSESLNDLWSHSSSMHTIIDTAHDAYKKQVLQQIVKNINKDCMLITHSTKKCITELSSYIAKMAPNLKGNVIGVNLLYFELSLESNKCIEIIPSWDTVNDIINRCKGLVMNDLNRECVVLHDSCAFISNRLNAVYLNEAFHILQSKICSAEDIDKIQKLAMVGGNMAPFGIADKIGLNVIGDILDELYKEYGLQKYVTNSMLKQYIRCGKWGRKRGVGVYSYGKHKKNVKNKTKKVVK